ncbi:MULTISPECIES: hypothetical protein [Cupriavidus]|uniref:hypothetical protein n=1 Tax=Cupriavidus alkaliphilus TaxID=942866 RepID=UPI0018DC3716|nr:MULTISPECIES: hypothetical protein [Cupriavidus]
MRHEDVDVLRMWWALSSRVGALAARLVARPREVSPALDGFRREVSGELPGPPDAAASVLLQAITLDPAAFVVTETSATWLSGANRVLAKNLDAARAAVRAAALHARGGLFDGPAKERLALLDDALRVAPIRELLATPAGRSRIEAHERRQAAKARAPLYRLSWDCASNLAGIDALEPESVAALLARDTLPGMETWRKFELAVLLEAGEALAGATGHPLVLDASFAPGRPAAKVGDIEIRWQRAIPQRPDADLDPGEIKAKALASAMGVAAGTARADIAIERAGRILSIIECKWFGNPDSASRAILEASPQIVAYARDVAYAQGETADAILSRSLVALADRGPAPLSAGAPIGCVGLSDVGGTILGPWAAAVAAA